MLDYTELVVVRDRSGSMEIGRQDHEGGLKSFVRDQRRLAGDVRFTLVQFDSQEPFELVYDGAKLEEVDEARLALVPRGGTPLLDALGRTLEHVRKRLIGAHRRPDQVVVMVITDGQENSSRTYTKERIKELVTDREASGWKVLYLGANVDEFHEAGALGVVTASALGYAPSGAGISAMYASLTSNTLQARSMTQAGATPIAANAVYAFTPEQRAAAKIGWVAPQTTTEKTDEDDSTITVNAPQQ